MANVKKQQVRPAETMMIRDRSPDLAVANDRKEHAAPFDGRLEKDRAETFLSSERPTFAPLDRSTLQEQAYQQLRGAVMSGVFKPGTVMTIRAVADALGTSPMPVRAALQRLGVEGALKAFGGNRSLTIPTLTPQEYAELIDIGVLLEGLAAERSAERISPAEIAGVEQACHSMQEASASGNRDAYVAANWTFHVGIYRASHMHTLLGMIERRWLRTGPYVRFQAPSIGEMLDSMPNHWNAINAIKRGDGAGARHAIVSDLKESGVRLLKLLRDPTALLGLDAARE